MGRSSWSVLYLRNNISFRRIEGPKPHPNPWRKAPDDIQQEQPWDVMLSRSSMCSICSPLLPPKTLQFPPSFSTLLRKLLPQTSGWCVLPLAVTVLSHVLHLALSPGMSGNPCKIFLSFFMLELLSVLMARNFELASCQASLTRNWNYSNWLWLNLKRFSITLLISLSELIQAMPVFSTGGPKKCSIFLHWGISGYVVMYYNKKSPFLLLFWALQKNPELAVFTVSVQDQASISSQSSNDC